MQSLLTFLYDRIPKPDVVVSVYRRSHIRSLKCVLLRLLEYIRYLTHKDQWPRTYMRLNIVLKNNITN